MSMHADEDSDEVAVSVKRSNAEGFFAAQASSSAVLLRTRLR
jgi:hypothetical protein